MPHGRILWPGIDCQQGEYTYRHGRTPTPAVLTVPIGSRPAPVGNLIFTDDEGTVPLLDCRLDSYGFDFATGTMRLAILDRRWRWETGAISGNYNLRDAHDEIDPRYKRSLRELAALCFEQMGERAYSLGTLPAGGGTLGFGEYPAVNWDAKNPAEALEELIGQLDYHICLSPFTNVPSLVKRGEGGNLPTNISFQNLSPAVDLPEAPSLIIIAGDVAEFDVRVRLRPMAKEINGRYVPLDQVSYAPKTGWSQTAPPTFPNIPFLDLLPHDPPFTNQQAQNAWIHQIAKESVFRAYQVDLGLAASVDPKMGRVEIPGYGPVYEQAEIEIKPYRTSTVLAPDGYYYNTPAEVNGVFVRDKQMTVGNPDRDEFGNSLNSEKVNSGFRISNGIPADPFNNMVFFDEFMYKRLAGNKIAPADLVLFCAVTVRNSANLVPIRYVYGQPTGTPIPAGAVIVKRSDLKLKVRGFYKPTNADVVGQAPNYELVDTITNKSQLDELARAYALAAVAYYQPVPSGEGLYPGIVRIEPDGSLQEITWRVSTTAPPSTTVSQNRRHNFRLPSREIVKLRSTVTPHVLGEQEQLQERVKMSQRSDIKDLDPRLGRRGYGYG
jgi:hypothetical protein